MPVTFDKAAGLWIPMFEGKRLGRGYKEKGKAQLILDNYIRRRNLIKKREEQKKSQRGE